MCVDNISSICFKLIPNAPNEVIIACNGVSCECPPQPYSCPEDSILVENRVDDCCVTYECTCPNISCPLIMEGGQMVQPIPNYRGNQFPGRCCPDYRFEGNIYVRRHKKRDLNILYFPGGLAMAFGNGCVISLYKLTTTLQSMEDHLPTWSSYKFLVKGGTM